MFAEVLTKFSMFLMTSSLFLCHSVFKQFLKEIRSYLEYFPGVLYCVNIKNFFSSEQNLFRLRKIVFLNSVFTAHNRQTVLFSPNCTNDNIKKTQFNFYLYFFLN